MSGMDDNGTQQQHHHQQQQHDARRPNHELSIEEKNAKRELKRLLKRQTRRRKLQVRLQQAIDRRDEAVMEKTRIELDGLLEQETEEQNKEINTIIETSLSQASAAARRLIESVHVALIQQMSATRQHATQASRELLRNMTKGTQTLSMFQDPVALMGYTRHKFMERAMLVVHSLQRLQQHYYDYCSCSSSSTTAIASLARQQIWQTLQSVRTVCSVGCGPGCDALGVAAFFKSTRLSDNNLTRVFLLDWAIQQWQPLVDQLHSIIVPQHVEHMETGFCDVRVSLLDHPSNRHALTLLQSNLSSSSSSPSPSCTLDVDLFVVSYLLAETRDQWHTFFDDLILKNACRPGTLIFLSDPTAWQLHTFLKRYKDKLQITTWLDSSMDRPELQPLEGRVGPAVLLARIM